MRSVCLALAAILALLSSTSVARAQKKIVDAAVVPVGVQAPARATPRSAGFLPLFDQTRVAVTPGLNVKALRAEDALVGGPLRAGILQPVGLKSWVDGAWVQLDDGGWLWLARLRATGASAVRVGIEQWRPPPGAELQIFNPLNVTECYGPYTDTYPVMEGPLWTHRIYGEFVYLEYYLPPGSDPDAPASRLVIDSVANQYRSPRVDPVEELPCHMDPTCVEAANFNGRGVGALDFVEGGVNFFCTGALLNRTADDLTPLLMTATHCRINTTNAGSVLVTWFFATTVCNDAGSVPDPSTLPQTLGSQVLVRSVPTDWTLVGLRGGWPAPATVLLGWNANFWDAGFPLPVAYNISHPDGAYRRWASGLLTGHGGSRPDPDGGVHCMDGSSLSVGLASGLVEPGSSGSPVFDSNWRVRGTLSCAYAADCSTNQAAFFGRMDDAWTSLDGFLDPVDPMYVNGSYGGTERGTVNAPFEFVRRGIFGVRRWSTLYIEAGSYPETMVIERAMTLRARNGMVTIGQ